MCALGTCMLMECYRLLWELCNERGRLYAFLRFKKSSQYSSGKKATNRRLFEEQTEKDEKNETVRLELSRVLFILSAVF